MSDAIKHECGLAFIRLRKSLGYYYQKHSTVMYGLNKMYLLMEKQHNRGQDGCGVAAVKLNVEPGYPFLHRLRSNAAQSLLEIFQKIGDEINSLSANNPDILHHPGLMKGHVSMLGEVLLGHLRYGTQGKNNLAFCHPFVKQDTIPSRNLVLAGNFNLVNTEELFSLVNVSPGTLNVESDLAAMLEVLHHYLVREDEKTPSKPSVKAILQKAIPLFDGGFTFGGIIGNGDAFVARDAHGIRPAYYYVNDEVLVAASERAAIRTAFNVPENEVQELMPGNALISYEDGSYEVAEVVAPKERRACSFERIYFSRGSDEKIYNERKALGYHLSKRVLQAIQHDLKNTIFSFIPNTAEIAFYGLVKGAEDYLNKIKIERINAWGNNIDPEKLAEMITRKIRIEKIAIKDVKLRTFITEDASRDEMVQHVYDITYGTVRPHEDTLIVIDDSIVRGTTLKQSIVRMLARLQPKKIIIVSSAPQIRYPDCYGIDMSKMNDFIAFRAAIALVKEQQKEAHLANMVAEIKELKRNQQLHTKNVVRDLYNLFEADEISAKIAEMVTPDDVTVQVEVIYQTIEDLHEACPNNKGDWYFTGNYPTAGGNKVCNMAFINYMEGKNVRGY